MLTYDETMRLGADNYSEPITALRHAGWQVEFTQTGGMNAAILIVLEGGCSLLITDAEDSLSWYREDQRGWGVGFWADSEQYDRPEYDGALAFACSGTATDTETLLRLVPEVVRDGTTALLRIRRSIARDRSSATE